MEHTFYAVVKVRVESDLPYDKAKQHFEQECLYSFEDTEHIVVLETEWLETKDKL